LVLVPKTGVHLRNISVISSRSFPCELAVGVGLIIQPAVILSLDRVAERRVETTVPAFETQRQDRWCQNNAPVEKGNPAFQKEARFALSLAARQ
jgi:hypothetical protein